MQTSYESPHLRLTFELCIIWNGLAIVANNFIQVLMAHTTFPLQSREWLWITLPFKLLPLGLFCSFNLSFGSHKLAQPLLRTTPLKVLSFNSSSSLQSQEWPWISVQCR